MAGQDRWHCLQHYGRRHWSREQRVGENVSDPNSPGSPKPLSSPLTSPPEPVPTASQETTAVEALASQDCQVSMSVILGEDLLVNQFLQPKSDNVSSLLTMLPELSMPCGVKSTKSRLQSPE